MSNQNQELQISPELREFIQTQQQLQILQDPSRLMLNQNNSKQLNSSQPNNQDQIHDQLNINSSENKKENWRFKKFMEQRQKNKNQENENTCKSDNQSNQENNNNKQFCSYQNKWNNYENGQNFNQNNNGSSFCQFQNNRWNNVQQENHQSRCFPFPFLLVTGLVVFAGFRFSRRRALAIAKLSTNTGQQAKNFWWRKP